MIISKDNARKFFFILLGSLIYTTGMNLFVVPLGLYSGGILGIAQIIRTIIEIVFDIAFKFDISGIISFILNIPLVIFAYFKIGKRFIKITLFCIAMQSFLLSVIPIISFIDDPLTSAIIGGILCGGGIGLLLRNGGSSGGIDIIGMYITKRSAVTIGTLNMIIDAFVYVCVFLIIKDPVCTIYTFIFAAVTMVAIDKLHIQNINTEVMIITKNIDDALDKRIMHELQRGVSFWYGYGAYTGEKAKIIYIAISKYELSHLKKLVFSIDPNAFMAVNSGIALNGYFEKRL